MRLGLRRPLFVTAPQVMSNDLPDEIKRWTALEQG